MAELKDRLSAEIQEALSSDARTAGSNIDVVNKGGIVTLVGTAESAEARDAAEEIVEGTSGVVSVVNEIDILSHEGQDLDDPYERPDAGVVKGNPPQA